MAPDVQPQRTALRANSPLDKEALYHALMDEFGPWVAEHPNGGLFDWQVAVDNVSRALESSHGPQSPEITTPEEGTA